VHMDHAFGLLWIPAGFFIIAGTVFALLLTV
jgi:hypothetical protein